MTHIICNKPVGFNTLSPELKDSLRVYRLLSISGSILEYYEKDENDEWRDLTAIKRLEEECRHQEREIERLKRRQAAMKALYTARRNRENEVDDDEVQ